MDCLTNIQINYLWSKLQTRVCLYICGPLVMASASGYLNNLTCMTSSWPVQCWNVLREAISWLPILVSLIIENPNFIDSVPPGLPLGATNSPQPISLPSYTLHWMNYLSIDMLSLSTVGLWRLRGRRTLGHWWMAGETSNRVQSFWK